MSFTTPDEPTPTPARRRGRGGRVAAIIAGATLVLAGGAYGVGYALAGETLAPNTTVQGVPVGGLEPADAEAKLSSELAARAAAPLTITAADQTLTKTPEELGLGVDTAASIQAAGGEKSFDPRVIWDNLTGGQPHAVVVTRDEARLDAVASELGQLANTDPTNAELVIEDGRPSLSEAVPGRTVDADATKAAIADAFLNATEVAAVITETDADITTAEAQAVLDEVATPALSAPITLNAGEKSFEVTPDMVAAALSFEEADGTLKAVVDPDTLKEEAEPAMKVLGVKEPKDARITLSGGKPTIVESVDGNGIAKDELVKAVSEAMVKETDRTGTVTIAPLKAEFSTADAEKLGVKEITGEFTTSFPASAYRINNIGKSAGLVNGVLLKPGETFSMNKVLGPRTLARGWQAGGAIDGGRVVERMGGGISQTTTTVFNAIFFAGLEDVYHKPHSLYFSRYPLGREATLDYNSVDLKFRNNTDYGVLMQAFTNNPPVGGQGTVTVRVWSTKVYDVKASDPVKSNVRTPGPAIRNDSAVCSPQSAMNGFTVTFNRLFYQGGKLVRTEPFKWTYNTLTPVICTNPNARADRIER